MTAKIKLNAASGGGSVSIVAPTSTTSNANIELKLPIADGSSEQVIKTDGSGNLSFGQAVTARNLLDNGGFTVAQRSTSSTSSGYQTVDRWSVVQSVQSAVTQAQVDVASGTSPYTSGLRKALKVTNGNQSNGATAGSIIYIRQFIESQDIATSGWNYTDPNSKITLSFWIKSSVAQSFHGHLRSRDGTAQRFPFQTGSLAANTWTKITKVISGNSNLQFDTDTTANAVDRGLDVTICPYMGTNYSDSGATFDQWQAETSSNFAGTDMTTTWFTTNAATLEITGVQLEVGSSASAFAHETFAETLAKCQRYYVVLAHQDDSTQRSVCNLGQYTASTAHGVVHFPVQMRVGPSFDATSGGSYYVAYGSAAGQGFDAFALQKVSELTAEVSTSISRTQGDSIFVRTNANGARLAFTAEL